MYHDTYIIYPMSSKTHSTFSLYISVSYSPFVSFLFSVLSTVHHGVVDQVGVVPVYEWEVGVVGVEVDNEATAMQPNC